jgi:hypothetical protein
VCSLFGGNSYCCLDGGVTADDLEQVRALDIPAVAHWIPRDDRDGFAIALYEVMAGLF